MLDATVFIAAIVLVALWLWPQADTGDPYDDPDNWGSR